VLTCFVGSYDQYWNLIVRPECTRTSAIGNLRSQYITDDLRDAQSVVQDSFSKPLKHSMVGSERDGIDVDHFLTDVSLVLVTFGPVSTETHTSAEAPIPASMPPLRTCR
jgi:hypothetical protein